MTYTEAEQNLTNKHNIWRDKINEIDNTWDFEHKSWSEYYKLIHSTKEYKDYLNAWRLNEKLKPITYREPDEREYNCRIPLSDFIQTCKHGYISSYDGSGSYGTYNKISNVVADPDEIYEGNIRTEFDYVWWYNK